MYNIIRRAHAHTRTLPPFSLEAPEAPLGRTYCKFLVQYVYVYDPRARARAGVQRRVRAGQRIVAIGLVAVEEMLAVEHRLAAARDRMADGIADGV